MNFHFRSKYPLVKQYDQKDCGPAALLSILKYYDGNSSLPYLRELCNTNLQGSTMLDLVNAAKSLGFKAIGASGEYDDLMIEKMPCIAHVVIDESLNHFVVVYKIEKTKIYISDSGKGKYWLSKDEFLKIWKSKAVILIKPEKELLKMQTPQWYNWIYSYIKKEESWVYQSLFLGVVYTLLGLVTAFVIQLIIDKLIPQKDYTQIFYSGLFLILVFLIKSTAGFLRQRFLIILNKNLNTNINADFLEHLFKLPKKFFDTRKIGEITARINDAIRIQRAIWQIVGVTIIDVFVVISSFAFMFYFSEMLALLSLCLIPIYGLVLLLSTKKIKSQQNEVMKGYALVESNYFDSLKGVDEIMGYNTGHSYSKINKFFFGNYQEKIKTLGFTQSNLNLFAEAFGSLIIIGILILGSIWVIEGKFLVGEMMATFTLLSSIIPAVNRFVDANIMLQETSIASTRLMDMILVDKEYNNGNLPFVLREKLSIQNGAFSWNGRRNLFENVNITIPKGKVTSLWGNSGAGKSTIVQVLQRKYKLQSGSVLCDQTDVEDINLSDYRKNIAVVPQSIKIFNGTIADNIMVGRSIQEFSFLQKRINELGLIPFYERFEFGLYTIIGENGRELSGGEKQLLSITRALLFNPEILIIDEGLSGIDIELELMIFELIKKHAQKKAVLLITHNLNSIIKTDFVYILANGTILQKGTPQELILNNGYFKKMWDMKELIYQNNLAAVNE